MKPSTTTRVDIFLPKLQVPVGPNKSFCNKSRGLDVEIWFVDLKEVLICVKNAY